MGGVCRCVGVKILEVHGNNGYVHNQSCCLGMASMMALSRTRGLVCKKSLLRYILSEKAICVPANAEWDPESQEKMSKKKKHANSVRDSMVCSGSDALSTFMVLLDAVVKVLGSFDAGKAVSRSCWNFRKARCPNIPALTSW